jgi:hypothetical protein
MPPHSRALTPQAPTHVPLYILLFKLMHLIFALMETVQVTVIYMLVISNIQLLGPKKNIHYIVQLSYRSDTQIGLGATNPRFSYI